MSKPYGTFAIGLVAAAVMLVGTMAAGNATAEAAGYGATVPCWGPTHSPPIYWSLKWAVKPRKCAWHGSSGVHADYLPVEKMRWRSWGGPTACGRGTFRANSGFRAPTRFCLYRKVIDAVEGDHYTRIRGRVGRGCAWGVGMGRRCGVGRPFHFRVTVS
jgi:hypothetical protein